MINWKKDAWVIVLIAVFLLVALTDKVVWLYLSAWWPIVALLCLGAGLIIGAVWGRNHARQQYAAGFRAGENWRKS